MRGRRGRRGMTAVAALAAACTALAGCQLALPPKPGPTATRAGNPATVRLADAPALLVQCAISHAGLRPGSQDWLQGQRVRISATNALNFETWFDAHQTHYLAFGATWARKGGQWVPTHTALSDPLAERTSMYGWALWAAANH